EVIARDLDEYKSKNVQIVTLEPGYDMGASYLSEGWFKKVNMAVRLAKERDMRVYLVDEGKYPSGFAGGKISREAPALRMKALLAADTLNVKDGKTISLDLDKNIVSAVAFNENDSSSRIIEINSGKLHWTVPDGDWQLLLVKHDFHTSPTRSVTNPDHGKDRTNSLIDYLDPEATRKFIEFTHKGYKRYVEDEFGKTVLGFRGDEPDYSIRGLPCTPEIFTEFKKRKAYDVQPFVASFFIPNQSEKIKRIRADYWDVWSTMFADNFFKVQADWCAEHDLKYLVHLNHEDKMPALVRSEGDFFRAMRPVQMPGVDAIWHQIWPNENVPIYPKYASSAAHLFGRRRSFTESFAAYRPRPNIEQAKWILDHQLVRGLNMVEVMFVPASTHGKSGMRGWLADKKFPEVAKYIQRACYLLSQGQPAADIAVYFPTSSMWLKDDREHQHALQTMHKFLQMQRDFDIVDEQALGSVMQLEEGEFINLSGQSYSTVVIPSILAISRKTLNRLEKFANSGGQVIFIGRRPELVVEQTFRNASGPEPIDWAIHEKSGEITDEVINALPQPDFKLNQPCEYIKYNHRHWKNADLYFVFNESKKPQKRSVTLEGKGQVQIWHAMHGKIEKASGSSKGANHVEVDLKLGPWETRFIVVGSNTEL
ncbi:MAG: hypothetical protein K9M80_02160, partial [Candidatus Marinimicrobia bacterium]|nr:hypothetical protein [Candidatus Neomarinimicrobiota bacterium]